MRSILPDLVRIDLFETFGRERLDTGGDEDWPRLEELIQRQAGDAVIAFDLRKLRYLGYSYAKRTIRRALLNRNAGEYGERRFFLVADQGPDFLDGLRGALEEQKLFVLVAPTAETAVEDGTLLGAVPEHIQKTFKELKRLAPIPTGKLADVIEESPQNTKNRLDRLYEMGLLRREKVPSPSGGLEWMNRIF